MNFQIDIRPIIRLWVLWSILINPLVWLSSLSLFIAFPLYSLVSFSLSQSLHLMMGRISIWKFMHYFDVNIHSILHKRVFHRPFFVFEKSTIVCFSNICLYCALSLRDTCKISSLSQCNHYHPQHVFASTTSNVSAIFR